MSDRASSPLCRSRTVTWAVTSSGVVRSTCTRANGSVGSGIAANSAIEPGSSSVVAAVRSSATASEAALRSPSPSIRTRAASRPTNVTPSTAPI